MMAYLIANAANLAFLLLIFTVPLNLIVKNKIAQLVLMILFSIFVLFIPIYHTMTVVNVVRGVIGDLSISGLLFLLFWAFIYFTKLPIDLFNRKFCLVIVLIGLVLYLSVLDIFPLDIYGFGYLPRGFLVVIFLLCILFLRVNYAFALIWLVALIAFLVKLQNSANLWDYLIDPVLWLMCGYKLVFYKKSCRKF
ncbi:MAG: hypothetical protein K0R14_1422 [Burkholderiales bacterium]|jgi:hypothetical protein|nr:hypothetical protein [Burkholderiales bacterium]